MPDTSRNNVTQGRWYLAPYQQGSCAGVHASPSPLRRLENTNLAHSNHCNGTNQVRPVTASSTAMAVGAVTGPMPTHPCTSLNLRAHVLPLETPPVSPCQPLRLRCTLCLCPPGHRSPCILTLWLHALCAGLGHACFTCFCT
jgi:hypothetical protein